MALAMALAAAGAARNIVLLGDPQQLEQPSRGAHPEGADVAALVHILGRERSTLGPEQGLFLDSTYRLHPDDLRVHLRVVLRRSSASCRRAGAAGDPRCHGVRGAGLFLVEVSHEGNQAQANEEVEAVFESRDRCWRHDLDRQWRTSRPLVPDDILVVAPYNAQVAALQRRLSAWASTA